MKILVIGINHKTAPIALREKVALSAEDISKLLPEILEETTTSEVVILSTCNRTEIYCDTEDANTILSLLLARVANPCSELISSFYHYEGREAIEHIMKVASGVDSMVVGETQILGQLKNAVALSIEHHAIGTRFHQLFQAVFRVAKRIRSTTEIGLCPISVAAIAVKLAKKIFPDFDKSTALLVGAGETITLVAKYLYEQKLHRLMIASRNLERAENVAAPLHATAISLEALATALESTDLLISATQSSLPLIGKGLIERVQKIRQHRPLLLIDLALPRDIETEVSEIAGVKLCTLDDLKEISKEHHHARGHAVEQALMAISKQAEEYLQWLKALDSTATIRSFRNYVTDIREVELKQAQLLLAQGKKPEDILQKLAHRLTNKILHQPTLRLRQAGSEGEREFLASIEVLFGKNT